VYVRLLVEGKWQVDTSVTEALHFLRTVLFIETVMRSMKVVVLAILQSFRRQKQKELLCQSVKVIMLTVLSQLK